VGNPKPRAQVNCRHNIDYSKALVDYARQLDPTRLLTAANERHYADANTQVVDGPLGESLDVVIGPGFNNADFSVTKNTRLNERLRAQFRAEFFDLFNHPNFGQPGNVVGTPSFGRITNTRFATGESGSSRQVQFAIKLVF